MLRKMKSIATEGTEHTEKKTEGSAWGGLYAEVAEGAEDAEKRGW